MKVLFICTANVCRSPLAEGYLNSLLLEQNRTDIVSSSAGVAALNDSPAFDCALDVARIHGFDITQHRARRLTLSLANENDKILCMESWQASAVIDLDPSLIPRVALLGSYYPGGNRLFQIRDPRQFAVPETLEIFELIKTSVDQLIES